MKELTILIVDDDAIIGMLLTEMLTGLGHKVCAVEATQEAAVTGAMRCRPELKVVDAQLGRGSGVAAVREILRTSDIPFIMMSASAIDERLPGDVMLQKPFREAELVRAIAQAAGAS